MKRLYIVALIEIGIALFSVGYPTNGITQSSTASAGDKSAKNDCDHQTTKNCSASQILSDQIRLQQEIEAQNLKDNQTHTDQEVAIETKLAEYTRQLVSVGNRQWVVLIVQTAVLFFTWIVVRRQSNIMNSSTEPSLHIDKARAINFGPGQNPIFFLKIINTGLLAAHDVSITMNIDFAGSSVRYDQPLRMTIPAGENREAFIICNLMLTGQMLDELNKETKSLRICGQIDWAKQPIKYCYKYYPWPFTPERPKDLPLFVPCDFDSAKSVGIAAHIAATSVMSGSLTAIKISNPESS